MYVFSCGWLIWVVITIFSLTKPYIRFVFFAIFLDIFIVVLPFKILINLRTFHYFYLSQDFHTDNLQNPLGIISQLTL